MYASMYFKAEKGLLSVVPIKYSDDVAIYCIVLFLSIISTSCCSDHDEKKILNQINSNQIKFVSHKYIDMAWILSRLPAFPVKYI